MSQIPLRMVQLQAVDGATADVYSVGERVLFGAAEYCQHRAAGYRVPMTALAACYGGQWYLHNLRACQILLNGEEAQSPTPLSRGQRWKIGPVEFNVTHAPVVHQSSQSQPRCSVEIAGARDQLTRVELPVEFLLGRAVQCDLPSSAEFGLASRQCLFAGLGGEWVVHDLTGAGGQCNNVRFQQMHQLSDADQVQIGKVRIRVICLERPFVAEPPDRSGPSKLAPSRSPTPEASLNSGLCVITDATIRKALNEAFIELKSRHATNSSDGDRATLREKLNRLKRLHAAEVLFGKGRRDQAIAMIRELLFVAPFDRSLLLSLARMCDAAGLDALCFQILQLQIKEKPKDGLILRALARLSERLGQRDPRLLRKAVEFWEKVSEMYPSEAIEIGRTIERLEVDGCADAYAPSKT